MTSRDVVGLGFSSLDTVGLVPHLPQLDEGAPLLGITRQGGGPVAQALVTLRRLGADVGFVGSLGDDEAGQTMVASLQAEGVDTSRLFITPGYRFRTADMLLTNFHLPRSTLFMLVSAFCGMSTMRAAYAHAIQQHFRFYSYGDACLLIRNR